MHDEALLTPKQLIEWFAERGHVISHNRVCEQLKAGNIPGYKVGKCWLTPLPLLNRWAGVTSSESETAASTSPPVLISMVHRRAS